MYKILIKVLATRLKRIISKVVGPYWSSFVDTRQILVAAMFTNKSVDSQFNVKKKVVCKLDTRKAFDCALCDCLLCVLKMMGFGERWCNLDETVCLSPYICYYSQWLFIQFLSIFSQP